MIIAIILIVVAVIIFIGVLAVYGPIKSLQAKIERRKLYVESLGPQTRILVNNGTHLFWIDDATKTYGVDESGARYDLDAVFAIRIREGCITIHQRVTPAFIDVGKAFECKIPITAAEINAIKKELMVYIRKKLEIILAENGVIPTHEYEFNGDIWGCDINSKQFYTTYAGAEVHQFSNLLKVTADNGYDEFLNIKMANKRILVLVNTDWDDEPFEYSICADNANLGDEATWNALLAMFKGIRNRA